MKYDLAVHVSSSQSSSRGGPPLLFARARILWSARIAESPRIFIATLNRANTRARLLITPPLRPPRAGKFLLSAPRYANDRVKWIIKRAWIFVSARVSRKIAARSAVAVVLSSRERSEKLITWMKMHARARVRPATHRKNIFVLISYSRIYTMRICGSAKWVYLRYFNKIYIAESVYFSLLHRQIILFVYTMNLSSILVLHLYMGLLQFSLTQQWITIWRSNVPNVRYTTHESYIPPISNERPNYQPLINIFVLRKIIGVCTRYLTGTRLVLIAFNWSYLSAIIWDVECKLRIYDIASRLAFRIDILRGSDLWKQTYGRSR